jgi:hypothetical protein
MRAFVGEPFGKQGFCKPRDLTIFKWHRGIWRAAIRLTTEPKVAICRVAVRRGSSKKLSAGIFRIP